VIGLVPRDAFEIVSRLVHQAADVKPKVATAAK
jgi:hypothetical protein